MKSRHAQAQGAPVEVDGDFPNHKPGRGTWFRAHARRAEQPDGGCWHYASLPARTHGFGGRFDLEHPRGTCYWAASELAAARERLARPGDVVAHDEVVGTCVSRAIFDPGRLADLLHRDAALHGVTQELSASVPYDLAQRWAAAFCAAGFDGVHYQPRFTTERTEAVACFGPAGRPVPDRAVISQRPVAEVLRDHGYTIINEPGVKDLSPLRD